MDFTKVLRKEDMPEITDVVTKGNETTVKFSDLTSVTVKLRSGEKNIDEAIAYAIVKRFYGLSVIDNAKKIYERKHGMWKNCEDAYVDLMNATNHQERVDALNRWKSYDQGLRRSVLDTIPTW